MECVMNDTWLCFLWNWLLRRFGQVPSGPLKQHPFLATLFVYLFPSNCNMFPCSVNILAFRDVILFTSVISRLVFSPDRSSKWAIISNYLWPNNFKVWDSQTLHLCLWHHSPYFHLDQHFKASVWLDLKPLIWDWNHVLNVLQMDTIKNAHSIRKNSFHRLCIAFDALQIISHFPTSNVIS